MIGFRFSGNIQGWPPRRDEKTAMAEKRDDQIQLKKENDINVCRKRSRPYFAHKLLESNTCFNKQKFCHIIKKNYEIVTEKLISTHD